MPNNRRRMFAVLIPIAVLAIAAAIAQAAVRHGHHSSRHLPGLIISPQNGTPDASPHTQISLLGASPSDIGQVTVVGSRTGRHSGRLQAYASEPGASFLPTRGFSPGERVTVTVSRSDHSRIRDTFTIGHITRPRAPGAGPTSKLPPKPTQQALSFTSRPDLHPTPLTVNEDKGGTAPGYLFAAPFTLYGAAFYGPKVGTTYQVGDPGPTIYDNAGNVVWYQPVPAGQTATDFRTATYHGQPVITWWQGQVSSLGEGEGEDVILDSSYKTVAVVKGGNGVKPDLHEFYLQNDGAAWVTADEIVDEDLSSVHGPRRASMADSVVQEIDVKTGLVMWEWHALGHLSMSESDSKPPAGGKITFDPFHVNSIEPMRNGDVLLSARNTSALYHIRKSNGAVVWRLGGKRSSFRLGPGLHFAYQHDARVLPDGDISLFDDEGAPFVKPPTRGVVLHLDDHSHRATLVQAYVRSPSVKAGSQGSTRILSNGDVFMGWGAMPEMTEFTSAGRQIFDATLPPSEESYRAFRMQWNGQPTTPPDIAVVPGPPGGGMTVHASWNGATAVASWQVLAGASAGSLTPVATVPKAGFDTAISVPSSAPSVEVRALDAGGKVLGTSNPVAG